jgi:hypothetical protein
MIQWLTFKCGCGRAAHTPIKEDPNSDSEVWQIIKDNKAEPKLCACGAKYKVSYSPQIPVSIPLIDCNILYEAKAIVVPFGARNS